MATALFNRDAFAKKYALHHLKMDSAVQEIYYLPTAAPERDIRFIEVNKLIGERVDDALEPIEFGIDMGRDSAHSLFVLDVTPKQWRRIEKQKLALPEGWSLDGAVRYGRKS